MRAKRENTKQTLLWRALVCLVSAAMVMAFTPVVAWGVESVPYLDANGNQQTCTMATEVTGSTTNWSNGWYVVNSNVTINSRITVNGDVHLILSDGCTLTAELGIRVRDTDKLSVYGQTAGTGSLTVTGLPKSKSAHAAIGGNGASSSQNAQCGGTVTINGGIITINSFSGAGIGGGGGSNSNHNGNSGGTVTINGGHVNATSNIGAGIGGGGGINGGIGGSGGTVVVTGGTVIAQSTYNGYNNKGIGSGLNGNSGGTVIVTGGTVNASYNAAAGIMPDANDSSKLSSFGDLTLPADLTIPSGKTLTIPQGSVMDNQGTITNNGKIYVDGTFTGTADNLYYPLSVENATATASEDNISYYNTKNYGRAGSEITLTPDTPQDGYSFDKWEVSLASVTVRENNKFTMPNSAITIASQYKDVAGPVISGIENNKTYCDAVEFEVSDNDGVASVKAGDEVLTAGTNGKYTLEKGKGTVTVVAKDNAENETTLTVTVNDGHTADNDDGNCTTPVYCIYHPNTIVIEEKSHDFSGEWNKNATNHWHICQNEGCTVTDTPIPHSGGSATCTAKAECEYCSEEYGELDSSNHSLEKISAKDATVTETGNIEYYHCRDCGRFFTDENGTKEIKPDDTVIAVNAWVQTVLRLQATATKKSIKLKWNEVPEADGYVIYWNKCGAKNGFKQVKVFKSGKTLTWTHKNRKANTWNKYYVKAYKVIDGKKTFIKTSNRIHLTTKGGKYTNVKKLKASVSSVTLNQGKTKALKITQVYAEKNKKIVKHMRPLTYTTLDKTVATVTSKGVIKAKGTGSCYIYITAHSGVYTRVKVTVK